MKTKGKIITVFRSRLNPEHEAEYAELAPKIHAVAQRMPGLSSAKTFVADDGERVIIVEFDTMEHHQAWSEHPAHRTAKELGTQVFYQYYQTSNCKMLYEHPFNCEVGATISQGESQDADA